ncbi:PREDICTED: uncharacterized protein LOC108379908 [Rhagoletis zephyria]|uniref:uncharacterized protein LOC108379908 n=1 Tax=Rhagoletis zephyria TaxID=28612 RepID=UPI0008118E84|nr:PREDICTED: uncharacterized protein LOC108379908 [Rhagoletis zephyria]
MIVTVQACLYAALTIISHVSTAETAATAAAATEAATEATKQQQGGGGGYEQERAIAEIVAKSLALYSSLFEIFRQSNRVAGQICQNAHMFTAWLLFSGMQLLLNSSRQQQQQAQSSGAAAVSLQQQQRQLRSTSGLANPLAKHALKLMASLLDDLHLEFGDQSTRAIFGSEESDEASGDSLDELNFLKKFSFTCPAAAAGTSSTTATTAAPGTLEQSGSSSSVASGGTLSPSASQTGLGGSSSGSQTTSKATFKYNKFGHYSAWQRIEMIVSSQLNVIQLLFSYLSTGYRRACLIRTTSLASAASVAAAAAAAAAAASEGSESGDAELGETASTGGGSGRNFSIEDLYTILLGEAYRNSGQHHHQQHQEQEESLKQTTSTAARALQRLAAHRDDRLLAAERHSAAL